MKKREVRVRNRPYLSRIRADAGRKGGVANKHRRGFQLMSPERVRELGRAGAEARWSLVIPMVEKEEPKMCLHLGEIKIWNAGGRRLAQCLECSKHGPLQTICAERLRIKANKGRN